MGFVRRLRWPATAPPACGGVQVHGRRLLSADAHLTLDLLRIVAYPSGLAVHLTLTATGQRAEQARHETRPLTNPADPSAQWSYLDVWAGTDELAVADPFLHRPDRQESAAGTCRYRTQPMYWLPASPPVSMVALTAEWPQIGLPASVSTVALFPAERSSTPRRG
ncbi:serine/threonine protein kinase [Rhodococcus sp. T2V]|uniref:serine/threonine protein kinase n=1 Tax=Rhodococcus sp. T2V TaxID=3034164 RepID=UPI0023E3476C|nr:serine/threonine protein kinase [Rhodococcus sp. T2V]MDF3311586.1 serine/threonine protein kinase [Rhodococcus sp. T2V]